MPAYISSLGPACKTMGQRNQRDFGALAPPSNAPSIPRTLHSFDDSEFIRLLFALIGTPCKIEIPVSYRKQTTATGSNRYSFGGSFLRRLCVQAALRVVPNPQFPAWWLPCFPQPQYNS